MACNAFRDIGSSIARLLDDDQASPIIPNVLLRGPLIKGRTHEQLGCPLTIINLRMETEDIAHLPERPHVHLLHCPMANKSNVYDTQSREVRVWLADIFRQLEAPLELPILIHCKHGRDRTGVAVAVLLLILGVPKNAIMEEFLLTDGARMSDLQRTFAGVAERGGIENYFQGMLDLNAIRGHLSLTYLQEARRQFFHEALRSTKSQLDPTFSCLGLLDVCGSGLRLRPADVDMHAGRGWALVRLGRHAEGREAFTEGLRLALSCNLVKPEIVRMMERELEAIEAIQ